MSCLSAGWKRSATASLRSRSRCSCSSSASRHDAGDHLLRSILDEWPSYLAYLTSFMTIGVIWLQHSAITGALRAADATLYRLNLLVLLLVGFIPFPTKLVSEFIDDYDAERVAVVFYGLTLLALALALTAFVRYAAENPRLVRDEVAAERRRGRTRPSAGLPLLRDRNRRRLLLPENRRRPLPPHCALRRDPGAHDPQAPALGASVTH